MDCFTDLDRLIINQHGNFTFYHYTYENKLSMIMDGSSGLMARREVACPAPPQELEGCYLVEGFLSPLPNWLTTSQYYRDLGMKLTEKYIGDLLLEITIPVADFSIYIGDYAHILECKIADEC